MGGDLQAKVDTLRSFKVFSTFSNLHLRKMALHFERRKFLPHTSITTFQCTIVQLRLCDAMLV
jgi:hypothetical protein